MIHVCILIDPSNATCFASLGQAKQDLKSWRSWMSFAHDATVAWRPPAPFRSSPNLGTVWVIQGVCGGLSCTVTETLDKSKWHQAAAIDGMCHWQLPATVGEFLVDARNTEDNETVQMSKSMPKNQQITNPKRKQRHAKTYRLCSIWPFTSDAFASSRFWDNSWFHFHLTLRKVTPWCIGPANQSDSSPEGQNSIEWRMKTRDSYDRR